MKLRNALLAFIIGLATSVWAEPAGELTEADIPQIMRQILAEHVESGSINADLMQDAIDAYIDQFDPKRTYLLAGELERFRDMSSQELQAIAQQYQNQNFAVFAELDAIIQKSIFRARALRHLSDSERVSLFQQADKTRYDDGEVLVDGRRPFASSSEELKQRWRNAIAKQLNFQMSRYGSDAVLDKQREIVSRIEDNLREHEQTYLYVDDAGKALSAQERRHYFTLHVLKALATGLDPHTAFYDESEAFEMRKELDKGFSGIGIVFAESPEGVMVNEILPDSPAAKSGAIKPKDFILAVNGQSLEGKSLQEVAELVRNHRDQPVTLVLKHKNELGVAQIVEVRLTPAKITLTTDRTESGFVPFEDGIIGWITLHSFYEGTNGVSSAGDIKKAINDLRAKGKIKGLILDLRDNGGGYLTQAVKVAGLFISNGVIVVSKYNDGSEHYYREIHGKATYDGPLIVLTSRATASASEIVAQALQDYGVALVVGDDRTYGKGTIQAQTVTDRNSTSFFKVTVGKYYTVSGKTAQLTGVKPDVLLPGPYSRLHIGEQYLPNALPNDKIDPSFNDKLVDIDPFVRDWYLRYYVPSLQKPTDKWRLHIPKLQKLSAERIQKNRQYQELQVKLHQGGAGLLGGVEGAESKALLEAQLKETVNILMDMYALNAAANAGLPKQAISDR